MSFLQWRKSLLLAVIASAATESLAFQHSAHNNHRGLLSHHHGSRQQHHQRSSHDITMMTASAEAEVVATQQQSSSSKASSSGQCYYRRIDGPWKVRKELNRIFIGERLFATRLLESDLLEGKTGPKVFLECGIGKINKKGEWSIVNGMARLTKQGMKKSVVRKKLKKMPPNTLIEVYVSKIRVEEGTFEVCLNRDEALEKGSMERSKIPASSLKEGETLSGTVKQVTPYGVFVDVNANRNGLLHISKVAKQRDEYIAKEDGLKKIGLGRGSSVNVIVLSNTKKRLELDLAPVVEVEESPVVEDDGSTSDEDEDDEAAMWAAYADDSASAEGNDASEDEAAMWAAYAADPSSDTDEDEDEDDEDTDIEDALGIGTW